MSSVNNISSQVYSSAVNMQSSKKIHDGNDSMVKNTMALQTQVTVAMLKQTMDAEKNMAMHILDMLA